jgi:hypothetical protein
VAAAPAAILSATLAYGSTAETERVLGGIAIRIAPRQSGVNRNGLAAPTNFYPGILLRKASAGLPEHCGTLGRALPSFRYALRKALGIGQGSCRGAGAPAGSRRGRIVVLKPRLAAGFQSRLASRSPNTITRAWTTTTW